MTNGTRLTLAQLIELRRALLPVPADAARASLSDRFLLPPFSVLDARQGYWQKRKRMWLALGIQSELGRGESMTNASDRAMELAGGFSTRHGRANATVTGSPMPATALRADGRTQRGDGAGRPLPKRTNRLAPGGTGAKPAGVGSDSRPLGDNPVQGRRLAKAFNIGMDASKENNWSVEDNQGSGTSIFDPVLCEIAYRWFCPRGGRVLDPFAGGSVRGIVAAITGRSYVGIDLRPEQVEANYRQSQVICPDADLAWIAGDSLEARSLAPGEYDLIFGGPPFGDLERYSDDPRDLSTMEYPAFLDTYRRIVAECCTMLKEDRFAIFNTANIRDRRTGNYRNFVGDTVDAFRDAGLALYNEAILVTAVGSLPIRVGKQFAGSRKLGKTHQQVLVFLKGDAARAAAVCGEVDVDDLEMPACAPGAVAVCAQDCAGLAAEGYYDGNGADVVLIDLPPVEARLLADIVRGEARASGRPVPRTWVGTPDGWRSVGEEHELTYLIGDEVYYSRAVFPGAEQPVDVPPPPRRLRS